MSERDQVGADTIIVFDQMKINGGQVTASQDILMMDQRNSLQSSVWAPLYLTLTQLSQKIQY